ncbi:hypothetical protein [Dactylosporangium matsuzakiense]|nr:hypothetical protein [Dactylosporangium matsuzakiense]
MATHHLAGAPPTWFLSNHDTICHATRYGREDTTFHLGNRRLREM